jgi:FkbM family methyltransferase
MSQQSHTVQTEAGPMFLDVQDSLKLGEYGYYEPEETALIKQLLKSTDTALDIGAHIGYFTLLMAKQCKWVDAFEPEESNFRLLFRNLSINKTSNVMPHKTAVAETTGWTTVYFSYLNSGMHRIYRSKWCEAGIMKYQPVEQIKIDDVVRKIDFIKMDIEGSELGALKGMKNLLTNSKPIILMEFCPQYIREYGADPRDVYYFLKDLGYSIRLLPDKDTSISYLELLAQTDSEPTGRNILCLPE